MYKDLTPEQIERIFAEDVLEWCTGEVYPRILWWMHEGKSIMYQSDFHPLTNLDHAMMGVGKSEGVNGYTIYYSETFDYPKYNCKLFFEDGVKLLLHGQNDGINGGGDTLNEAIAEACIRIVRPDLFDNERGL